MPWTEEGMAAVFLLMRPVLLAIAFALLMALFAFCWNHRFEYPNGSHAVSLADLRASHVGGLAAGVEWRGDAGQASLHLAVAGPAQKIVQRFLIPKVGMVKFLHARVRLRGDGLVPGEEIWEDGRLMLEWHRPGVDAWKVEALGSVRYDQNKLADEFVLKCPQGLAVPALRLEHLGTAGAFELQELELREVHESVWWRYGRWAFAVAWLAWGCAAIRSWKKVSLSRALGASAIFVIMGVIAVVPGQWKIQRPLGHAFEIKENPQGVSPRVDTFDANDLKIASVSSLQNSTDVIHQQPLGKIPVQGGILLKAKHYLPALRPVLHMLLVMAPTLAMAWLVGWRPALSLAMILSAAIEIAQTAFGYGFDRTDVIDLVCDALGIAAAVGVYHVIAKIWSGGKK